MIPEQPGNPGPGKTPVATGHAPDPELHAARVTKGSTRPLRIPGMRRDAPDEVAIRALLRRLDSFARTMDSRIGIPGTPLRFGLDSVIGFVPVLGDVAGGVASGYVVYEAWKIGAPTSLLARMMRNVGVELIGGAVPIIGDVFDVYWKSNLKNVALLRSYLHALLPPEEAELTGWRKLWKDWGAVVLLLGGAVILWMVIGRLLWG